MVIMDHFVLSGAQGHMSSPDILAFIYLVNIAVCIGSNPYVVNVRHKFIIVGL